MVNKNVSTLAYINCNVTCTWQFVWKLDSGPSWTQTYEPCLQEIDSSGSRVKHGSRNWQAESLKGLAREKDGKMGSEYLDFRTH